MAVLTDSPAQTELAIYTDKLVNGFQDWGWAPHDFANTSPVFSGTNSLSVTISDSSYQGLQFVHSDFDSTPYASVGFKINGGNIGGQKLQVFGLAHVGSSQNTWQTPLSLGTLQTNVWQQFVIPLSSLGIANKSNVTGIVIQDRIGAAQPTFYLDDIQFNSKPAPPAVSVTVNAAQIVRTADSRWFGVNTAVWDNNLDTAQTVSLLNEMGTRILRFPGGSLSDEYHWASNKSYTNDWQWATSFAKFIHVATNAAVKAQAMITVNYGSGTPNEAAAWVKHANVTNQLGFKYWEIGNECYGTWETDSNTFPHDAYTYAVRAADYIQQMKAADPTIKVGVVAVTGENTSINNYSNHPAINPRTGQTNYGWTPVLLSTLKSLNVTPDFLVHHVYPEYTGTESDPLLLQSTGNWVRDAADLRQQITDYCGSSGTNIELLVTENNSNAGQQGKQSTSLINGLYFADSLGQLMNTEFNAFVWWDLRNGTDTGGLFDSWLYGWRSYGDLGMINGRTNRHPTFYAAKLMKAFCAGGDSILSATTDYAWLTAFAARRSNGALTLLVLNKDTTSSITAQLSLDGFASNPEATIRSYGIPQDEATRTNAPYPSQDIATNSFTGATDSFTYTFAPLSMTLFTFAPIAPVLTPQYVSVSAGKLVLELRGQSGAPYVVQASSDLRTWIPVSTNVLPSGTLQITNAISSGLPGQFWRAVWLP